MKAVKPQYLKIRFALPSDLPDIVRIYNQAITAKVTADTKLVTVKKKETWLKEHKRNSYPLYVAILNKKIIGWCSLSAYRKGRKALEQTLEVSYYIDYDHHRKGYGKQMLQYVLHDCIRLRIKNLFALILEGNSASISLLRSIGFQQWGFMPLVANFNDKECGHVIMGLRIQ